MDNFIVFCFLFTTVIVSSTAQQNYFSQQQRPPPSSFAQQRPPPFQQLQRPPPPPQNQPQQNAVYCPERNIRYPNPNQCDVYVECLDGVGKEVVCPDGLLFNSKAPFGVYPCQYPVQVDCEGRTGIQPAQPTDECPNQYGVYRLGDANNCGKWLNCANGKGFIYDCPEGLAYNEKTLTCEWADEVPSCNAEGYLGFTCPLYGDPVFDYEVSRSYRHPTNCQKYFSCIKGRPRLFSCGGDQAFNEYISACDGVENVTGCAAAPGSNYERPTTINIGGPRPSGRPSQQRPQYQTERPQPQQQYTPSQPQYNPPGPQYTTIIQPQYTPTTSRPQYQPQGGPSYQSQVPFNPSYQTQAPYFPTTSQQTPAPYDPISQYSQNQFIKNIEPTYTQNNIAPENQIDLRVGFRKPSTQNVLRNNQLPFQSPNVVY